MKVYLSSEQFVNLFWDLFKRKMGRYNPNATTGDNIIWAMFQEYETEVKETLEGAMWNIEDYDGEKAVDLIGYQFHKSFRQTDVIPAKHIDGIIWQCIQDSVVFWKCLESACMTLTKENAAELYELMADL